jgi:hypothetical protein
MKLLTENNIECKLCIINQFKRYRLFRYYVPTEYLKDYLSKREQNDNYIMNIAIIGDFFMNKRLTTTNELHAYTYLYSNVFDTPFLPEKYNGALRLHMDGYHTNNKYLLIIPVAINYCTRLESVCYDTVLNEIDLNMLDELYKVDVDSGTYYLK